jgi:hypothetical protein
MRAALATMPATVLLAAAVLTGAAMQMAAADEALKVCLDESRPPFSVHHRGKPDSAASM